MEKYREQIEAYLGGSMSEKEMISFETLMETNVELRDEVILSRQANLIAQDEFDTETTPNNEYTEELRTFLKSDRAQELKASVKQASDRYKASQALVKPRRTYWLAASVLVLVGSALVFQLFKSPSAEALYLDYYDTKDLPSLTKRDDSNLLLEQGLEAFREGNFELARERLSRFAELNEEVNPGIYLYTGVAFSETNELEDALKEFDKLIESDSLDKSKGWWFKAMVLLNANQKEASKEILKKIASDANNFKYTEAKELLDKL